MEISSFVYVIAKKWRSQNLESFLVFGFSGKYGFFPPNLWALYLPTGTTFEADCLTIDTTYRAPQGKKLFNQVKDICIFSERNSM